MDIRLYRVLPILLVSLITSACSSGGSSGDGPKDSSSKDPENTPLVVPKFNDINQISLIQDQLVTIPLDNIGAGNITKCEAQLPDGINLLVSDDAKTCVIQGEAKTLQPLTNIEVIATNAEGTGSAELPLEIVEASPFITRWKTDNPGVSDNNQITLTLSPDFSYRFNVDWGDGNQDKDVTQSITHTYTQPGEYQVSITGRFAQPFFDGAATDANKIIAVESWGNRPWLNMRNAFAFCNNLVIKDILAPNLSRVNSTSGMFKSASGFNSKVDHWDMSSVADISSMFEGATQFNQPLNAWNVKNVINMEGVFRNAKQFDQALQGWNIEQVNNLKQFATGSKLSLAHYDALLNTWSTLALQKKVVFGLGTTQFSENAENARSLMTNTFGWTINDGGLLTPPKLEQASLKLYTQNSAEFVFNNSGGAPTVCEAVDLPKGVSVQVSNSKKSCALVGFPSEVQEQTTATIMTRNVTGESTTTIDLTVEGETPFITRWKTDNQGLSEDNQITLFASSDFIYRYTVNWGDGTSDTDVTGSITHTYDRAGTYSVEITGHFPYFGFQKTNNAQKSDALKLLSVEQWGKRLWFSMKNTFLNCRNLEIKDETSPDLSRVRSLNGMFANASRFNTNIGAWDVSTITDMQGMFLNARIFNQDIGSWDVSNVTKMSSMFRGALAFNQDIGGWDVSNVTAMKSMFFLAKQFNQDIGAWDVSKVKTMDKMFREAITFDQALDSWDVSSVSEMGDMFFATRTFNGDITSWDTSNVTSMSRMFRGAGDFDQNLQDWNVTKVTNMKEMFLGAGLSTENYDALLIGWSQLDELKSEVELHAGDATFTIKAKEARDAIINRFKWNIIDAGLAI